MIDGNLQLVLNHPTLVIPRLVLLRTLAALQKTHAHAVAEFRDKVLLLQKEKPLTGPAHGVIQRMIAEVFP